MILIFLHAYFCSKDVLHLNDPTKTRKESNKKTFNRKFNDTTSYEKCAVTTEVPLCSKLGVDILKKGGNAMDAAIASTICVGIVNSFSSGLGGGGFLLVRKKGSDNTEIVDTIDFRETAPANLTEKILQKKKDLTKVSGTAVGVPGELKGLYKAHKKYGKLPWKDLFEENIEIAKEFTATEQLCRRLEKLKSYIFADEGLKNTYTRNGELIKEGEKINRPNLAKTLQKIAEDLEDFYVGDIAESLVKAVKANGGVLEKEDLKNYKAIRRKPLKGVYRDYTVYTTGLPTSGIFIILALNILEKFDLLQIEEVGKETDQYPHYHLLIEIFKFMSAKRGELADPAFLENPEEIINEIKSDEFATKIVEKIDFNSVLNKKEYGRVFDSTDDHGTTHLNVIDEDEMVVMITSTVNLEFGAKFLDDKTGIILNDEIDDFYVPNVKNAFDLDKMTKNILEPNKRPFSSAAPVLMINKNEIIAIGAAGGTRIPTSIFSVIFHLILGKTLSESIMESRIHNQLVPDYTYIESNLPKEIKSYLKKLGHKVAVSSQNSIFTSVQGIRVKKRNKMHIEAFSDKRKGGLSAGY